MSGVAVVTGATGGIGRWIALGLAQAGCHVILVGRDRSRGEAARNWIAGQAPKASTELRQADLSSVAQTAALARSLAAAHPRLALLVNNAGVFRARRSLTAEGHDEVLAVNYLAPFVLMRGLEPALRAGAPSRLVTVGSSMSDRAGLWPENLEPARGWNMVRAYGQSKLAVMIATFDAARRLAGGGVTANVVHPGLVATGLVRAPGVIGLSWRLISRFALTEQQGADTPLHAATSPALAGVTGRYFKNREPAAPNRLAGDPALAARLRAATERLLS